MGMSAWVTVVPMVGLETAGLEKTKSGWTHSFSKKKWLQKAKKMQHFDTNLPGSQPFGSLTASWFALSHLACFKESLIYVWL